MDFVAPDFNIDKNYKLSASLEADFFSIHHIDGHGNIVRSVRNEYDFFEYPKINKPEELIFCDLPILCLPEKHFDKENLGLYLDKFNASVLGTKDVYFKRDGIVFAFRIPIKYKSILKLYKRISIRHQMEWMLGLYKRLGQDGCYIHATERNMFLTVFKDGQLQLHQCYNYHATEDVVYRWLAGNQQFFGRSHKGKLFISGAIHDFSIFTPFVDEIETIDEEPYDYSRFISVMKEGIL